MSKAILDALKSRLYGTTALTNIFGTAIYLDQGPVGDNAPILVYRSTGMRTTPLFGGVVRCELDLEFRMNCGNSGDATGHTAAAALQTALATPLTSVTGFDRVRLIQTQGGVPSFDDDSWTIVETYRAVAHDT